jgi:hypothetical protein
MQQQQHPKKHAGRSLEALRAFIPAAVEFDKPLHTRGIRRPAFNVGEYLPAARSGETEIARISLASTTGDVVSIRARKRGKTVSLSVHDEYETVFMDFRDKFNGLPTQGELVDLLCSFRGEDDDLPYLPGVIEYNGYETADEVLDFITVDSALYPDLDTLFRAWVEEQVGTVGNERGEGNVAEEVASQENTTDENRSEKSETTGIEGAFLEGLLNHILAARTRQTPWQSLMGTLCFNLWHHTNEDFLRTGDRKSLTASFLVTLNLFQQWDRLYLSKEFDRASVSEGAGAFVRAHAKGLLKDIPAIVATLDQRTPTKNSNLSHAFAWVFNETFTKIHAEAFKSDNPLEYFQLGVEILFLLVPGLEAQYPELNRRLLDIRPFDKQVEEIIEAINALETK